MAASEKLGSNFWRQLVATGVSNIGDGMVHAAAPLLTLSLTDDPRLIAGVIFIHASMVGTYASSGCVYRSI